MTKYVLIMILSAVPVLLAASELPINQLVGTYKQVDGNCDQDKIRLGFDKKENSVWLNRKDLPGGYSTYASFDKVNKKYQRYNDDFATYNDYIAKYEKSLLTSFTRQCQGLVFIRCNDWQVVAQLEILNVNKFTLKAAGYQKMNCLYERISE